MNESRSGAAVPSPCINVCRMDATTGLCAGCLRTIEEIAAWGSLDDAAKREVWQRITQRRASSVASPANAGGRPEHRARRLA
jgi:predicted Fe-S protein YdhL (DUF1289 family)